MPLGVYPRRYKPLSNRLWSRVEKSSDPNECWLWTGQRNWNGYGTIRREGPNGKKTTVHRAAWEIAHGAIPKGEGYHGTCVLHRCDIRNCVNPSHLFLGTHLENIRDKVRKGRGVNQAANARKAQTHCKRGHEFTPENTRPSNGGRSCKRCEAERNAKYWRERFLGVRKSYAPR